LSSLQFPPCPQLICGAEGRGPQRLYFRLSVARKPEKWARGPAGWRGGGGGGSGSQGCLEVEISFSIGKLRGEDGVVVCIGEAASGISEESATGGRAHVCGEEQPPQNRSRCAQLLVPLSDRTLPLFRSFIPSTLLSSIHPSIHPIIHPSIHPSLHPSRQ
jgi:hypothetical protein